MSKELSVDSVKGEISPNKNSPAMVVYSEENTAESASNQRIKGSLIYLGPNIPSIINRFTVYKDGMPKHLDKQIQDCPDIRRLFVPIVKMSEVLEKINSTGTPYNVWFNNIIEFITKGVK